MEKPDPDNATFISRFINGTMYTSFATGFQIVSGMVSVKILTSYLPSADFGIVILMELVAKFLGMVSGFSIGTAAIKELAGAENYRERKIIIDTALWFRLATVLLALPIFYLFQTQIYQWLGGESVGKYTYLIPIFAVVLACQEMLRRTLQGVFRFKSMALVELAGNLLNLALLVTFLMIYKTGLVGAIMARILTVTVITVLFLTSLPVKIGFSFSYTRLKGMLAFSWPLQVNELMTFAYNSFSTVVVALVMTPADVALLAVAGRIPASLRRLYESFQSVYFPNLANLVSQNDLNRAQRMVNVTLRLVAFLMTLATIVALVFQREIILLLFSEQYLDIGPVLVMLMLGTTIGLVGNVLGNSTVAAGDSKAPALANIMNIIFTVTGNLLLVPPLGIMGAALTGAVSRAATNPLNVWFLTRVRLIPNRTTYLKPLALFGALYAIFYLIEPQSIWLRILFLAAFLVGSLVLSIVTVNDFRKGWTRFDQMWGRRLRKRWANG